MSKRVQEIQGIGPKYAEKLKQEGIQTIENLLEVGGSKPGRKVLASKTAISEKYILNWVNICDLFRIKGVAGHFAELLEGVGIDTVSKLCTRNAGSLANKMMELNNEKHLCKVAPNPAMVAKWIKQAKELDSKVMQ